MISKPVLRAVPLPAQQVFPVAANQCRVLCNDPVNAEYRFMLTETSDTALNALPGQFFHLLCPESAGDRPFLRRPMSVYRIDKENRQIGFLYKVIGKGTRGLATMRAGDVLDALGPLGHGFELPVGVRHALLIARGVGLATLAPLARHAVQAGAAVTAVLSARDPALVMSRDEFEAAGARAIVVTDADGSSDPSSVETQLGEIHMMQPFDFAATCGSNRLLQLVRKLCERWAVPGQVALEAHMGCGTGMCYACVAPMIDSDGTETYRRVCWDGPVFSVMEAKQW